MPSLESFFNQDWIVFSSIVIFLFGLCLGSFFNVCIWRIPRRESVISNPSHCPNCQSQIKWYDNIPVFSYLLLMGKCRACKIKISPRYIMVELITAVFFLIDYLRVVNSEQSFPTLIIYLLATSLVILTFLIDIKHKIIPDKINYTIIVLALITAFSLPESVGRNSHISGLENSLLGFIVSVLLLGSFSFIGKKLFRKDILGWGDVKYLGAVGACFGLIPAVWFFTLFIGAIFGLIFGVALILFRGKNIYSELPFGPFLAIGTYLWILCGPELTEGYFSIISSFAF
ncbi:MAG TPA: prepilin peptidase [Lentisphaeria bacterium]|nr:MAG: hypothetical protein A2X47_13880 [Lentisphaerae bacterium GWF2_38_69]HBM16723.1 prepilin peptidase [Lentisphaeria bacterium]